MRKGWVETSDGGRLHLVVVDRHFDWDGQHKAVRIRNTVYIEEACCDGALVAQVEDELGERVEAYGWLEEA